MVYCQHPSHAWGVATAPHHLFHMHGVLLQHPIFNSVISAVTSHLYVMKLLICMFFPSDSKPAVPVVCTSPRIGDIDDYYRYWCPDTIAKKCASPSWSTMSTNNIIIMIWCHVRGPIKDVASQINTDNYCIQCHAVQCTKYKSSSDAYNIIINIISVCNFIWCIIVLFIVACHIHHAVSLKSIFAHKKFYISYQWAANLCLVLINLLILPETALILKASISLLKIFNGCFIFLSFISD